MASKSKIIMKRALRGLYAGKHIRFGNKVSEDGGNKTRRCWKPNRQRKNLFSLGLDKHIRLDVTTHALRCIDKAGGLDEYLLRIPEHKLGSENLLYWRRCIAAAYTRLGDMKVCPVPLELEERLKLKMAPPSQVTDEAARETEEVSSITEKLREESAANPEQSVENLEQQENGIPLSPSDAALVNTRELNEQLSGLSLEQHQGGEISNFSSEGSSYPGAL